MFQFKWQMPGPTPSEVVLRIHSRSGWLGRKTLTCGGQTVFRRGWFAGVEARFVAPENGCRLDLRVVQLPNSADWRPALFIDGVELPEITGAALPHIVPPPKSLALPVGLTYLLMAMVVVMLPQTATILDALYLRPSDRKLVLTVLDPHAPASAAAAEAPGPAPAVRAVAPPAADRPVILTASLPPATLNEPYDFTVQASGGNPPYTWRVLGRGGLPKGLDLDARSARIRGTPQKAGSVPVTLRVVDGNYAASRDIGRWIVPFVVTTVCLLGFLAMHKWSVYAFGLLIVLQAGGLFALRLPISTTALGLQAVLWLLGAAHLSRMR